MSWSEERLSAEIELLRGRLNAKIDTYSNDKVKAVQALSTRLDDLLNEWYKRRGEKQKSR